MSKAGVSWGDDPQGSPFAGLVLDADFIVGATAYEASSRTRAAVAGYAGYGARRRPGHPEAARRPPRLCRATLFLRRAIVPVAVGLVVLLVTGCSASRDRPSADSGTAAAPTTSPEEPLTLNDQNYTRGHCYTWDQDVENTTAEDVPCAKPHLFEAVEKTNIAADHHIGSKYPTDPQWDDIVDRYCLPIIQDFLGYRLDPYGRFGPSSIFPLPAGWNLGDRDIVCGIVASISGSVSEQPNRYRLDPFTGEVEGADQAWVYPAGACLEITETETKGEVSCDAPHQGESTGPATLPDTPDGAPPSDDTVAAQAEPLCRSAATQHLGERFRETDGRQVSWLPIAPESWRAGTRTLTCTIIFVDTAGRFTSVTGGLRS